MPIVTTHDRLLYPAINGLSFATEDDTCIRNTSGYFYRPGITRNTAGISDPILTMWLNGKASVYKRKNVADIQGSWFILSRTWEQLGVPAGEYVRQISLKAETRVRLRNKGGYNSGTCLSTIQFGATEVQVGPIELCDNSLVVVKQLCPYWQPPARTALNLYPYYPSSEGAADPIAPFQQQSWFVMDSGIVGVAGQLQKSNTEVKFRFWMAHPPTDNAFGNYDWLRIEWKNLQIKMYSNKQGIFF